MKNATRVCWVFLLMLGLITIFLPQPTLAQERIDFTLTLTPGRYDNNVKVGQDNIFFLEIRNRGNKAISNISLTSQKPKNWVIEFKPETIDYLGLGSFQTVDVNIKPPAEAAKGKYGVTIIAEADGARKVTSVWVTVEKATSVWLWVGIILAFVVVAGFIIIFMRFNRQ